MRSVSPLTLVICSKSAWQPAIRREHALAQLAGAHGVRVTFIERPRDVRALAREPDRSAWFEGVGARGRGAERLEVIPSSVISPGHRGVLSERSSTWALARQLRTIPRLDRAAVVATTPWQWPAVGASGARRRVFDAADDWCELIPSRRRRLLELYARIDREADAITVASPALLARFPSGRATLVRNGVGDELLAAVTERPHVRRMVYTGTLSPRFDAPLAAELLERATGWELELYGECQYPRAGVRPAAELRRLLARHPARVRHRGVVPRAQLAAAIDRGAVAVILNRPDRSRGQDSMKLYDYAARGRPVVCTRFSPELEHNAPPGLLVGDTPTQLAEALERGFDESLESAQTRRAWAESQHWATRWSGWSETIFVG